MSQNLPINGVEYTCLGDSETQISLSDLSGRITYCNDSFMKACGYGTYELIGQPHNIVWHPDMPQTIFSDMLDTVERGFLWVWTLKNLRKNGELYWVVATAAPVRTGALVSGYVSVRRLATCEEIRAAEIQFFGVNFP